MKEEDVIRLATQAKLPHYWESKDIVNLEGVTRFAKLVAAHEREACAKLCVKLTDDWLENHHPINYAKAIRARGDNQ